jgi:hypothetical protein
MTEHEAKTDARYWSDELRSLVGGANLVVLVACVALGVWGSFDSMTDAGGDRLWGNLATIAPGVYAGWCMLEPALRRSASIGAVLMRMVSACLIAPGLVSVPIGIVQAIAMLFPSAREAIAASSSDNGGFHYYWSEGIVAQIFLVPFAGWIIGMCVALGVCLILSLPILSVRAPRVVATGSHIDEVSGVKRDSTTAFVFCGLGATVLGIALWVFGDGGSILDFPDDAARVLSALTRYGIFYGDDAMWLFGVVFVVAGVFAMGWGCLRVVRARAGR